jgi:hypothetical protein
MKRHRTPGMMIAFLDTLSNAMAAILILAITQLHPKSGEGVVQGFFFINAHAMEFSSRYHLEMKVSTDTLTVFSEESSLQTNYRFVRLEGSIALLVTEDIKKGTRLFVFLTEAVSEAPDTIDVMVDASLPSGRSIPTIIQLTKIGDYSNRIPNEVIQ